LHRPELKKFRQIPSPFFLAGVELSTFSKALLLDVVTVGSLLSDEDPLDDVTSSLAPVELSDKEESISLKLNSFEAKAK
jgi:hypothetical protein